jgi:hypothetical protein
MADGEMMTAKTVFDFAISTMASDHSPDPSHRDLLILRLKVGDEIQNFAFDRRTAERLIEGLPPIVKKLALSRHEN